MATSGDDFEGPLCAVLVQHTDGEARTVVLNQKMNQGNLNGFAALGMLAKRYNPKTTVQNLTCVDTGAESSDSEGREAGSSDWWKSGKLRRVSSKWSSVRSSARVVQIAILTGMLPSDVQDKSVRMGVLEI